MYQILHAILDLSQAATSPLNFVSADFINLLALAISQYNLVVRDLAIFVISLDISESR